MHFIDDLNPKLSDKIDKYLKINTDIYTRDSVDTPFTTVLQKDLWVNNIMIKKGKRLFKQKPFIE